MLKALYFNSDEFSLKQAKSDLYECYLSSCIFHSKNLKEINNDLLTRDLLSIKVFKKWYEFIDLIDNLIDKIY